MVPGEGFEPPTFGLQNRCTTTVLTRRPWGRFSMCRPQGQDEIYDFEKNLGLIFEAFGNDLR